MIITVRYFGGARSATGTDRELVDISPEAALSTLINQLRKHHGERLGRILEAASFLVDEVSATPQQPLVDGSTVDVLPPFAGG